MKLRKRVIKKTIYLTIFGCLLGYVLIYHVGPGMLLIPQKITDTSEWTPEKYGMQGEYVEFTSFDSIKLAGYLSKTDKQSKGIILLCHGIGSCKEHQFATSKFFNQLGFDALPFDGRAHGQSGGEFCTYGFNEKKDITSIINELEREYGYTNFYIYGASLGGGIALQALGEDARLKGGIIVSTFSTLAEVSYDYQKRITKVPFEWLNDIANEQAGNKAGFNVSDVKPEESCRKIVQPVFMIHGEEDRNINPNCGKRNFEALKSNIKVLKMIPKAGHNDAWMKGGDELTKEMSEFISVNF